MIRRRRRGAALVLALVWVAQPAHAGPPFLTDDPEPTDLHHWEIYAPEAEASGRGGDVSGSFGAELNYGAAKDVQVTVGLPVGFARDGSAWRFGRGDVEASVKYRFYHDKAGLSVAAFPGISIPTGRRGFGSARVTALLPVWAQKTVGKWAVFGGGGYALNPGAGNRDFWTGGVAATRALSDRLLIGIEADREGADAVDARAATSLGVGAILKLRAPFRLLASGGPTFTDGRGGADFHGFVALGIDL